MKPPDNHVHSEWSWDTPYTTSMEKTCRLALERGLPAVAFTEHVDFTDWLDDDTPPSPSVSIAGRHHVGPLDVEGYLASVERCRDRFPDLRILTGIEAGEPHWFRAGVAAVLAQGSFERVLGSLHSARDGDRVVGVDRMFARLPAADVVRAYLTEILALIDGSDVFQVLAHCDFPRRQWPRSAGTFREEDFEEEYRAVFRALATSGRALEINTRSPLWSAQLLTWWYQAGGEAVSFGSDAHEAVRVGARFDLAVDVVEAAGFRPGRDRYDFWRR
jgi:histidinol-phosphatase (PHP family)